MALLGTLLGPNVDKLAARGDVEGLAEVLTSQRRSDLRVQAAAALGSLGDTRGLPALVAALASEPGEVAAAARSALRGFGVRAVEGLAEALGGDDVTVGERALALLVECGAPAVEQLVAALKGGDDQTRGRVAPALITLWPQLDDAVARETAFRGLLAALGDRQPAIRTTVAEHLGAIADPRAAKALAARLKDGDAGAREAARAALGRIGEPAVPFLVDALLDKNPNARLNAVRLLGDISPACARREALVGAAEALTQALEDREEAVRAAAADALARVPPAPAAVGPAELDGQQDAGQAADSAAPTPFRSGHWRRRARSV